MAGWVAGWLALGWLAGWRAGYLGGWLLGLLPAETNQASTPKNCTDTLINERPAAGLGLEAAQAG